MALAHYSRTVTDDEGNIVPSATITVRRETSGQPLEQLYDDRSGSSPIGNPFTAEADGSFSFFCAGGAFQIEAVSGAFSKTERYVPIGTMAEQDVESFAFDAIKQAATESYSGTVELADSSETTAGTDDTKAVHPAGLAAALALLALPLARGYIDGCGCANNSTDATNDIDFSAGIHRDYLNTVFMDVFTGTKRLDANWAAGTNQGMRYSGAAITNTTYHLYDVMKADGTADVYADPSADPATALAHLQAETGGADYVKIARRFSIVRTGGAIKPFVQNGDDVDWATPVLDVSNATPGTSANTATLTVPLGIVVKAKLAASFAASSQVYISSLAMADLAPSATVAPLGTVGDGSGGTGGNTAGSHYTNTSGQVRYRTGSNTNIYIATLGYVDRRGKDA